MTKEQFDAQLWSAGMKVEHTQTVKDKSTVKVYDILSTNFFERLIGIDDGATEECEECGNEVSVITWFNYENCEIIIE